MNKKPIPVGTHFMYALLNGQGWRILCPFNEEAALVQLHHSVPQAQLFGIIDLSLETVKADDLPYEWVDKLGVVFHASDEREYAFYKHDGAILLLERQLSL